jgi:hypothetical protein
VDATLSSDALPFFIQRKLPAVPRARPKSSFIRPTLTEIDSLVRAITVYRIAQASRFYRRSLAVLLDFQEAPA